MKADSNHIVSSNQKCLLELIFQKIGAIDCMILRFWIKAITSCGRIVDRGFFPAAFFTVSSITGMIFVLFTASQQPGLNFSQKDTFSTSLAFPVAIGLLWIVCERSLRKIRPSIIKVHQEKLAILNHFRIATASMTLAISLIGVCQIKKFCSIWYLDGYFYLTLSMTFVFTGIYAHSAISYINLKEKIAHEQAVKIKSLTSTK